MTPQEAIKFLKETIVGCHILRDRQLKAVCEVSINALEKQMPKKPSNMRRIGSSFDMSTGMGLSYFEGLCEVCKTSNTNWRAKEKITYCEKCGQALDWSDSE